MKLLAVFLLVFSMVALTSGAVSINGTPGDDQVGSISCPFGWTLINNRCFQYVANNMTWAEAERNCLTLGANLASVHNSNEYNQIQTLIFTASHESKEVWIGGSNAQEDNIWLWSDGSPMSYTNWCRGQPDNTRGMQRCLQMNYSGGKCWDDFSCRGPKPSVCAKKP
ncbi:type-2 ice-structuring protein-like isoform X1 [Poecilia latipinna]|uniref:type-2 ice-structuring protein-like isoform X1 n=1 Tax=Poecilia latipinna TaxID=48699 RepID=UPI00072E9DCA|nr:PREDICTED: type-2 ice-structuring protein-like isoform X1 [Poecilia latipinna]